MEGRSEEECVRRWEVLQATGSRQRWTENEDKVILLQHILKALLWDSDLSVTNNTDNTYDISDLLIRSPEFESAPPPPPRCYVTLCANSF